MKAQNIRYIIILLVGVFLFASCKEENNDDPTLSKDLDELEFELSFANRAPTSQSLLEDFKDYFVAGESCVLISQRSSGLSLNFETGTSNCYEYIYYENNDANWDKNYNFKSENPLDWEKIRANGQYSNGFAFGALFYPRGNENINEVEPDQSNNDTFYESDVLGAWHRTSIIRDRLRFKLNHLMCKLHINLYIPVLNADLGNGFNPDEIVTNALSFRTDYDIEWGDRTTELPPIAKPSASKTGTVSDIKMYNRVNGERTTLTKEELKNNFNIDLGGDFESDDVWKYSFEVIFPEQTVQGDFIRFILTQGKSTKNYLFNSAYLTQNANGFAFKGGAITTLELYLPRQDNEIVLINAEVRKWGEAQSSFTIIPET